MWDKFTTGLEQGIDKFVPVRKAGTRVGFSWINQERCRLIRKRDKLYKRWSRSGRPYDQSKFIEYKHLVRRVSDRAYEKYQGTSCASIMTRKTKMLENPKGQIQKTLFTAQAFQAGLKWHWFQSVLSPKTPISLKSLAQKSLQDLHDSCVNQPFQPSPYPKMPDISISAEGIDTLLVGLTTLFLLNFSTALKGTHNYIFICCHCSWCCAVWHP